MKKFLKFDSKLELFYLIYIVFILNRIKVPINNMSIIQIKMKSFSRFILLALFGLTFQQAAVCPSTQVKFDNQCFLLSCFDVFNARFGTVIDTSGIGRIPITFQSSYTTSAAGLTVSVSFLDNGADKTFKYDNVNSCLVYKLNRYNQNFTTLIADETANYKLLNSTYNAQTGYTTWTFFIPSSDYSTKLIKTVPTTNAAGVTAYIGAFAFDFYISSIRQASYQFTFTLQISSQSNTSLILSANGLTQNDNSTCAQNNCTSSISTEMWICSEPTCAKPMKTIPLALNNNYWLLIKITSPGLQNWTLSNPSVLITGSTTAFPSFIPASTDINSSIPGQIIIKMKQKFALQSFTVQVTTDSAPPAGRRVLQTQTTLFVEDLNLISNRLLQDTNTTTQSYQSTSATKSSVQFGCVKEKDTDEVCPDCLKQFCLNQGLFVDGENCNSFDKSKGYESLCPKTVNSTSTETNSTTGAEALVAVVILRIVNQFFYTIQYISINLMEQHHPVYYNRYLIGNIQKINLCDLRLELILQNNNFSKFQLIKKV
ncbi:hypothetical protein pb186bvf_018158 [Paramecium bursaria]